MYTVNVANESSYTWQANDGTIIEPNGQWTTPEAIGNAFVQCQQLGTVNFLDIGDTHVPGDSDETWGVLISYQGEEVVGRYEGQGELNVTITGFGQAALAGMDLRQVQLPSFIFTLS
jgi:hypothetical protein